MDFPLPFNDMQLTKAYRLYAGQFELLAKDYSAHTLFTHNLYENHKFVASSPSVSCDFACW